jgi:membrane-associated phospholipid phosphatase
MAMPIAPLRPSPVRSGGLCCLFALSVACPAAVAAQSLHSEPVDSFPKQTSIHWWQGAAVLGGVSALMLLDGTVRQDAQAHRTPAGDRFAESVRHFGQPEVYGTVTAGILTAGLVTHNPRLIRTGTRIAGALVVAGGVTNGLKMVAGRGRPDNQFLDEDPDDFSLFSGHASWPSGHTAMAFAFATALGDELHQPVARYGLLAAATAVGWSRINDNRHWLSDVAGGAVIGITSAKFASGRWRVFGIRAPSFIVGPTGGMGLGYHTSF